MLVAAWLKQLNPRLINFHCVCHRLALACTDSLENVSYIKVFWHGWLSYGECFKIHQRRWLSTSKPRLKWNCWNCQAMRPVNVPQDIWKRHVLPDGFLSMHPLTKTVDAEYPASLHTLNTLKNTNVTALGLFSKVKDVKFIGIVYILAELLPYLSNLSRAFQRGTVDFSRIAPVIEYTKEKVEEAAETKSPSNKLKADLLDTGRLGILDMNASLHHLKLLGNLASNFHFWIRDH